MASLTWAVLLLAGLTCTHALGTQTSIQELPSIAQIEFRLVTTWRQQCLGSIVTNYHIVSAASCFKNTPTNRRIRVGSATKAYGGVVRDVASINNHPSFGSNGIDGDITVVRVQTSWNFGLTINAIQILAPGYNIPPNLDLKVAGFGVTAEGGLVGDRNLYTAILQSKSLASCSTQHVGLITQNMLCVGLKDKAGRDLDLSDTGAPVIYSNILAGVISFGKSNSQDNVPLVAKAISAYSQWIQSTAV